MLTFLGGPLYLDHVDAPTTFPLEGKESPTMTSIIWVTHTKNDMCYKKEKKEKFKFIEIVVHIGIFQKGHAFFFSGISGKRILIFKRTSKFA